MSLQKTNTRTTVLIVMVLAAIAMRIVNTQVPALSNFTPVGAVALFGGAYFADKWKAYLVPLLALVISDMVINYIYAGKFTFYTSSLFMYGCFMLMTFVGTFIKKVTVLNVAAASVVAVLIHWFIMDLPFVYGMPNTWANYGTLLVKAVYPFETNMLIGDAVYGAILFGGFELAKSKFTALQGKRQLAL
ncbi:hypothetical protein NAF17_05740 [Mucilaginibacter sp. RB4R14]|uniref:DUF6580 family putative transport protein n=1 Tax=Mucilaginibacter aurantiaciroseus TaxID=2949308 RepID=UPI002090AAC7|nr:DUF6580 family putative transport protein [Mucilaginibacter aurantiaciroseus]MCO5935032.1 hypothetical protein [Mucilaginibacter aurantiaciroseus]